VEGPSSKFRFLKARDVNELFCKMYLPHVLIYICAPPGSSDPISVQRKKNKEGKEKIGTTT
jgi:hypothetical protein